MTPTLLELCKNVDLWVVVLVLVNIGLGIAALILAIDCWRRIKSLGIAAGPGTKKEQPVDFDEDEDPYNEVWNSTEEYPEKIVETIR